MSARLGWPLAPRRALDLRDGALSYVVSREREELRCGAGRVFVHPGMLASKLGAGPEHPLIRALGGARTVLDATLGLAGDALHAAAFGAQVRGVEASPVLLCLAEEGLERLRQDPVAGAAAARVSAELGCSEALLIGMTENQFDAVLLDPMFDAPAAAQPGFELLRRVAHGARLSESWLREARRVGRRVVIKAPLRAPAPHPDARLVGGKGASWWVVEGA